MNSNEISSRLYWFEVWIWTAVIALAVFLGVAVYAIADLMGKVRDLRDDIKFLMDEYERDHYPARPTRPPEVGPVR